MSYSIKELDPYRTWFTSDLHFNHNKEFLFKPRGFNSVEDMNEAIISRFNSLVGMDDTVFILGDIMLTKNDISLLRRLKGWKYIILGNHDTDNRIDLYSGVWDVCDIERAAVVKFKGTKDLFYLSHYPALTGNPNDHHSTFSIHGHTHSQNKFSEHPLTYNVAVDAHNCEPVLAARMIMELKERNYNG